MDFDDSYAMSYDYEKNRLKYFKEELITSKIIKSIGGIATIADLGYIGYALSTHMNLKDLDAVGLLLFLFIYIYYRGNKEEIYAITSYAEYLEQNGQSLSLIKNG